MGTSRGKQQEQQYQQKADAAVQAWQPSPLETKITDSTNKFLDQWNSGTDVGQMDELRPYYNLFNASKNRENNEKGVGTLGYNALTGGSGQQAALAGQQLQARNEQDAQGQLYNAANQAHQNATNTTAPFLIGLGENRMAGKAGLAQQQFTSYLNRPQKPSIWSQIIGGAAQVASAAI